MPTNLPPEYFAVEERYRAAQTHEEKISTLEELISTIPKHKGTDKLRADLRRRLSKLKNATQTRKDVGRQVSPYHIDKEGAGQVVIVGPPNVGKSSLVAALTNATPEVAEYPFSTHMPVPGMMPIENIQVQLIDTPPLNEDFVEPQMMDLIRRSDLVLLIVDLQSYPITQLEDSLALLKEQRILPQHLKESHPEPQRFFFKPVLVLVNKTDDEQLDEDFEVLCELVGEGEECPLLPLSAETGRGVDRFKRAVFDRLGIMRIYSKPPGKEADLSAPFVLPKDSTVQEFAAKVHGDFVDNLKSARIWGTGVYDGQMVGREHQLHDGDVVELRV